MLTEDEFVQWLRGRASPHGRLAIGIGDDAALVDWAGDRGLLVASDLLADAVHFELATTEPQRIGRKALAVNLSDVAAMAGRPVAATVSVLLPRSAGFALARDLYEGLSQLAANYDVALAGGDTNTWDGPLVIEVTILAEPPKGGPLRRTGAQAGDWLLVTGSLGGSALGHHLDFEPRVREAMRLVRAYDVHAGMDISDGLALDLSRLAEASGCGAIVDVSSLPISAAARELASRPGEKLSATDRAIGDGEDFELLLAMPPDGAQQLLADQPFDVALTNIGTVVAERGLWQRKADGGTAALEPRGYRHGADS